MNSSAQFLNPAEAARRLGVSVKALRLYEQRGLIAPARTAAGWPEALSAESLTRHTMTLGQAAALQFHCVDGCDSDGTGVQSAHPPRPDQEIH